MNFTKTELQYIEVALYMLSKEKVGEVLHSEESIKNIETIATDRNIDLFSADTETKELLKAEIRKRNSTD